MEKSHWALSLTGTRSHRALGRTGHSVAGQSVAGHSVARALSRRALSRCTTYSHALYALSLRPLTGSGRHSMTIIMIWLIFISDGSLFEFQPNWGKSCFENKRQFLSVQVLPELVCLIGALSDNPTLLMTLINGKWMFLPNTRGIILLLYS